MYAVHLNLSSEQLVCSSTQWGHAKQDSTARHPKSVRRTRRLSRDCPVLAHGRFLQHPLDGTTCLPGKNGVAASQLTPAVR